MNRYEARATTAIALALLGGSTTLAQAETGPPAVVQPAGQVSEIVVTAQKRSQSISNVGMAITALTGAQLKQQGIYSVPDLVKADPSFVFSQAQRGAPVYSIRGVGYNDFSLAATPTVSVYTDEAPYAFPIMTKGASFDLDRVEVLKGPQGTVFGQNATGGAINYIAAKPTRTLEAGMEATYGSYGATNVNGFVSGPVSSTLAARLAFNVDEGGAWQRSYTREDRLGNKDAQQGRLILDWRPTDRLKLSLNLNAWKDRSDTQAGQEIGLDLQSPKYAAFVPEVVNEPIAPANDRAADWLAGTHPKNDETYYQATLRAEYEVGKALSLVYLGTYERYTQHDLSDNTGEDARFFVGLNGNISYTSQELRANGKLFDGRADWLVGVNYARAETKEDQDETLIDSTSAYALTTVPLALHEPALPPFAGVNNISKDVSEAEAVFGNVEYHVTPTLDLHAGARYTNTDIDHGGCTLDVDGNAAAGFTDLETLVKRGVDVTPIPRGGCVTFGPGLVPGYQTGKLDQDNVSWRAGVDWKPIDKTLVYVTVSKGYKSGSFPTLTASSYLQLQPVTQESVLAYEGGIKSRLFADVLELNASVFHYDYDNKQVEAREPDPEGVFGFLNVLLNVPKSKEDGAEVVARLRPATGLTLSARATWLDSHVEGNFMNYNPFSNVAIDLQGEPFPNTPRWTTGFGAQYRWDVTASYGAFVSADVRYQSRSQGAFGAQSAIQEGYPSFEIDSYAILDLRAGISSKDGHWRGEVFGNNVTNTYYWTQAARPAEAIVRFTGMPATFGVKIGYSY
jgi:outer membrane receptor protein involved in Fe transport